MKKLFTWRDPSDAQLITLIAAVLIAAGAIVRVQNVGNPAYFTLDEELFATNAYKYLLPAADVNDHPPLGKLLLVVGFLLFDYSPVAWRFVPLCFGLFTMVIVYWLGAAVFERARVGLFAAAFVAADGFFLSYSRVGLLDGMLVCLVLWSFLAAVVARNLVGVLASAILVGLAASIKWSGVMAAVPAIAAIWMLARVPRASIALFAVVPLVHTGVWMAGLWISGQRSDPASVFELARKLLHHHQGRGAEDHGLASPWYSWLYLLQPIVLKDSHSGVRDRVATTVGNLALWASASAAVVFTPLVAAVSRSKNRLRGYLPAGVDPVLVRRALLLFLGWLALLVPWMIGRGKLTFIYHYLPSYGFALVLVAGLVAEIERRQPRAVLLFFVLVMLVAIFYAPVWGEFPISAGAVNLRLPFERWKP